MLSALRLWWESGGSITIHRALGLPATPARATLLIRDAWLREAGKHVSGDTLWQRARALAHELPHASRKRQRDCRSSLDLCLAEAIGSGAPIPGTAERLYQILEANFQDDLAIHALRCTEQRAKGLHPCNIDPANLARRLLMLQRPHRLSQRAHRRRAANC